MNQIYSNNLKNREFSDAKCHRFDSEKSSPLLDIGADFSKSKMWHSAKEKTDFSGYLSIKAIILRSAVAKGGLLLFPSLTNTLGRVSLATYKNKGGLINPFTLVEATITRLDGDFAVAQEISVLDSFPEAREGEAKLKSLFFLRTILEHCLPPRAPAKEAFEMTESLFSCLSLFSDWKVAPWLLSCHFFEQEGINVDSFIKLPKLSEQSKEKATKLLSGETIEWGEIEIPEDLFQTALELIGINKK